MKRSRSVIWAAFFAVLANVSSGQALCLTDPLPNRLDTAQSVCDTQSAIAVALGQQGMAAAANVCSLQRLVDHAGDPQLPINGSLDSPFLAVLVNQRAVDGPELPAVPLAVTFFCVGAETLHARPATSVSWATSMPPENRYRYLLTPHAPPSRA